VIGSELQTVPCARPAEVRAVLVVGASHRTLVTSEACMGGPAEGQARQFLCVDSGASHQITLQALSTPFATNGDEEPGPPCQNHVYLNRDSCAVVSRPRPVS
jgi:hypothetical protein